MPDEYRQDKAQPPNIDLMRQLLMESPSEGENANVRKPWAIKGIDEATIQLCKLAARGKGMKINRWVAEALSHVAQQQLGYTPPPQNPQQNMDLSQLFERISRLEGEVDALSKSHAAIVGAVVSR
jgi:hypothetical protein